MEQRIPPPMEQRIPPHMEQRMVRFTEPPMEQRIPPPMEPPMVRFTEPPMEPPMGKNKKYDDELHLNYKTVKYANSANPEVWGPAFWFSLHNGAIRYPIQPSPTWKERMKQFILGIPVMVPCEKCADHATAHLEANYYRMDEIVSSRSKLFEFFWEFHNFVNERLNKPKMTLDNAYKLYNGEVLLTKLEY